MTGRGAQDLASRKCAPCEGGMAPLTAQEASVLRAQLHPDWTLADDARSLKRALTTEHQAAQLTAQGAAA